jgi:hypothetical protein
MNKIWLKRFVFRNQVYRKKCTIVWVRKAINSQFEMIKARTEYEFSADLLYDVLQVSFKVFMI